MALKDSPAKALSKALGTFLDTKITSLNEVFNEWPEANYNLNMPSLTIVVAGRATLEKVPPYLFYSEVIDEEVDPVPILDRYAIGEWTIPLQLDFWCRNQEERNIIHDAFLAAFHGNAETDGAGLVLTIPTYYGLKGSFQVEDVLIDDSEEASQRNEWRVKIAVSASVKAVVEKTESAILETEIVSDISDTVTITE